MLKKIIELKTGLISLMKDMNTAGISENIISPPDNFHHALKQMQQPDFNIVVCGEVKRGKSTFINALIGKNLLPTGVKETTSQVFRVCHSEKEEYFLQFDDGSKQEINHEQLKHYGSQVDADLKGENVFKGKRLMYIQANIPIEFLPKGVTIVDTPGLGALYKTHEEITNNYISNADAVVFVLDTDKPLVQQEQAFLANHVFAKTPNVMFIMTKVDAVDENAWVELIRRNEKLLKDSFEKQCYTTPRIFPVASTLLFDAAQEEDKEEKEYLIEDSLFPNAKAELIALMNRTVGVYRNNIAYTQCFNYFKQVIPAIDEQIKMVSSQSKEEQQNLRDQKVSITQQFEKQWGVNSKLRSSIISDVHKILSGTRINANQLISSSHPIYKKYLSKIENADSSNIQRLANNLGESVVGEISSEWQMMTKSAEQQVSAEINKMHSDIMQFQSSTALTKSNNSQIGGVNLSGITRADKVDGFKKEFMTAGMAMNVGGFVLTSVLGIALGPIWPLIMGGSILYSFLGGKKNAQHRQLEKNKMELKKYLADLYDHARNQLLSVSVLEGKHSSTIDAFVYELEDAAQKALEQVYQQSKKQYDSECAQLEKQAKLNNEQSKEELLKLNAQKKLWGGFGIKISDNYNLLKEIAENVN